jgi:hypothetical protein
MISIGFSVRAHSPVSALGARLPDFPAWGFVAPVGSRSSSFVLATGPFCFSRILCCWVRIRLRGFLRWISVPTCCSKFCCVPVLAKFFTLVRRARLPLPAQVARLGFRQDFTGPLEFTGPRGRAPIFVLPPIDFRSPPALGFTQCAYRFLFVPRSFGVRRRQGLPSLRFCVAAWFKSRGFRFGWDCAQVSSSSWDLDFHYAWLGCVADFQIACVLARLVLCVIQSPGAASLLLDLIYKMCLMKCIWEEKSRYEERCFDSWSSPL